MMNIKDWITLGIGLIGLGLSIYNFIKSIARIRVSIILDQYQRFLVTNTGNKSFTIINAEYEVQGAKGRHPTKQGIDGPTLLQPGETLKVETSQNLAPKKLFVLLHNGTEYVKDTSEKVTPKRTVVI